MRKIPLYEEALNVFTLKLVEQSATSDEAKRVQINTALSSAYAEPETVGVQADALKDIINYKWAIVVIGLQIAYTKIHKELLSEFHIYDEDVKEFDFKVRQTFARDFDRISSTSFIKKQQVLNACSELFQSQLFANYCTEQLIEDSLLLDNICSVAPDSFAFDLLNGTPIDEKSINPDASVVDYDISCSRLFNGKSNEVAREKRLKKILSELLKKYSWSSNFLLKTHSSANDSKENNALYLAKHFLSVGGGTIGTHSLDKGLSSQFISMLDEDIRSEYVEALSILGRRSDINSSLFNSGIEYSYLRDNLWMFESVAKGGDSKMFMGLLCSYTKHTENNTPEDALYLSSEVPGFRYATARTYMKALHALNESQLNSTLGQSSGFEKYLDYIFSYHSYLNKFRCDDSFFISPTLNMKPEQNEIAIKIIKQLEVITDNVIKKYSDTDLGDLLIMCDCINSAISKHGENEISLAIWDIVNKRTAMMIIEKAVDPANCAVFEPESPGFNVY